MLAKTNANPLFGSGVIFKKALYFRYTTLLQSR